MGLVHKHTGKDIVPKISRPWACVDSGMIGISTNGETPFWSTGFIGCVGVAMCGTRKWGALAHLNQAIQNGSKDMSLALSMVADYVRGKVNNDKIVDVFLYYGDPGENLGQNQIQNKADWLTPANVKKVMGATGNIIDLRRTKKEDTYGSDFVYDPGLQFIYTAPGSMACAVTGLKESKMLEPGKDFQFTAFPFGGADKSKLQPGLRDKGCFSLK